jgi:hypothetical protein
MKVKYNQRPGWSGMTAICLILMLSFGTKLKAQLTGTKNIPGDYADLATAITDLNAQGVGAGGVTLNLITGNPQSAPAGGYAITTLTSSVANPIVITGNGNAVTASTALTAGALNDAIFKVIGSDYVTIQGFTMQENAANTTTAAASNNMTEWGVAVLYATTTDGAKNVTIQNNTISLNRTYQNTFGIYASSRHSPTAVATAADITSAAGAHDNLHIYGNNISNTNLGITVVGSTTAANEATGLDIGGNSATTGNTLTDIGTTGTFSGYISVSGTVNIIYVNNNANVNVSYNSITSSNAAVTSGALRGIFVDNTGSNPTGTITTTINSNTISLSHGGTSGNVQCINMGQSNANTTANINGNTISAAYTAANSGTFTGIVNSAGTNGTAISISGNNFQNVAFAVTASATVNFITNSANSFTTQNINGNTFTNISLNTTGNVNVINSNNSLPTSGTRNVNGNSIVGTFAKTGSGGTVQLYISNGTGTSGTETNSGNNFSNITLAGTSNLAGWLCQDGSTSSPYGPGKTVTGNTFSNITVGTGTVTVLIVGYSNSSSGTWNVAGNTISNVTAGGSITALTITQGNQVTRNNTINSINSTAGTAIGIAVTSGVTNTVAYNKVYDIQSGAATGTNVFGMSITSGTTNNIYNNLIGDLKAPAASGNTVIAGMRLTGGTTDNIFYNTILVNASSTGANFGTSAISCSTGPGTMNLRNNILINKSTPAGTGTTVALRRESTALGAYAATSNNNLLYAGTPGASNLIYSDGTNNDQTLAAFKTRVSTRETGSMTEDVAFVSTAGSNPNFLNVDTSIPTQVEGNAAPITSPPITDDYAGSTRNSSLPDVGAWEGTYLPNDLFAPAIASAVFTTNACGLSGRTATVMISDVTGVATGANAPRLYYKVNAGAYTSVQGTLTSGTVNNGTWTFNLTYTAVTGDVISYFIIAQDASTNNNITSNPSAGLVATDVNTVTTPPTTPFTWTIQNTMSGTYTVGSGGNFTTLTAAAAAYNTSCLTGPVIFSLTDATYSTSETFPITFLNNADASSTNTLTIRPATGVTTTITGAVNSNALIRILGNYITIDGSNNSTTTRDLTITNTSTTTPSVLLIGNANGGVIPIVSSGIKNTVVINGVNTATAVVISDATTLGNAGYFNGIFVQNNFIQKAYNGVYVRGVVASGNGAGLNISMNNLDATGTNAISFTGIYVEGVTNGVVSKNTIGNFNGTAGEVDAGIWIAAGASNMLVEKNIIHDIKYTGTSGYGGKGIQVSTGLTNCNVEISNNMIYAITGDADSYSTYGATYSPVGIYLFGSTAETGVKIYHNTISLSGATLNYGSQSHSFGIALDDACTGEIKNNIIINKLGRLGSTGVGAVGIAAETGASQLAQSNYNDYFCAAASGTNIIGKVGSTNYTTLAAYKAAIASEANSISVDAVFTSATDLHLPPNSNVSLNNLGTPIAVTTDIDGDTRSGSTPDMGADEFTPTICLGAVGGTSTVSAASVCEGQLLTVANTGASSGLGITYQWKISTTPGGPYTNVTGGTGATTTTYTAGTLAAGTYYFVLEVTCSSGPMTALSTEDTVLIKPMPTVSVNPTTGSICMPGGTAVNLTASGADTYTWAPTAGLTPSTGATVAALPTSTTNYTVTGTALNGCTATATASITVIATPVVNSVTATPANLCTGGNSQLNASVVLGASVLITEVTMYDGGTGATSSYPSYVTGSDYVELSNVTASAVDISGYKLMDYPNNSATANHPFTFPAGSIIPANSVAVINLGSGTDDLANRYFNTGGSSDSYSSGGRVGIVLLNGAIVVDAVGLGGTTGYTFNPGTGVTAADWSGYAPDASGFAGVIRSAAVDHNTGADWVQSNTPSPLQTIGTYNGGYTAPAAPTYAWTPTTFLSNPAIVNPMANGITATTTYTLSVTAGGCIGTGTVTVNVDPLTAVAVTATSSTVCAGASTTLTATPTGGGTPYTYTWMPGGATTNTITVSPSSSTVYTVTVDDACGASVSNTVSITVNALPVVTATATATSYCSPGSPAIAINASGADTYTWLPAAGLDVTTGAAVNATPAVTTTYTVTGTNALTGCMNTATASITALPAVTGVSASSSSATVCAGDTIDLTSTAASQITLLTENFNGATNSWTVVNSNTGTNLAEQGWNLYTPPYTPGGAWTGAVSNIDGSQFYMTNSDVSGTGGTTLSTLTSARIDASAMSTLSLSFEHFFKHYTATDEGKVQVSTNGTTFTDLQTYSTDVNGQSSWAPVTINMNAYAGNDSLYIRFLYNATWDFGWGIDNISLSGASSAMNYAWTSVPAGFTSGDQNPADVVATASTTYSVVVSNAFGCSASATTSVTVNAVPVVTLGNDTAVCSAGLPLTLDAGNAGSTYAWGTSESTQTISAAAAGSYNVAVTDGNGCVGRDTLTISVNPDPVVALGTDTVRCGGSVTLNAGNAGAAYLWSDMSANQTLTVSATGNYDVAVTDANGCVGYDTITVTINTIPTVDLGNDTLVCGTGITLDAGNAGNSFMWNTMEMTQTINAAATGDYFVDVTTPQNCTARDTVHVTIAAPITVSLGNDSAVCSSTSVILDAQNAGSTYLWSDNSNSSTLIVTTPGVYSVVVTSPDGCVAQDTVVFTDNSPAVDLALPFSITCVTTSVNALSGGSPAGGFYSGTGVTGTNFNATTAGVGSHLITYSYTDGTTGCFASDTQSVVVDPCIGIKELSTVASIVVAPNPTTGYFTISMPSGEHVLKAELYTIEGQLISSETYKGREAYEVNITNLANAVYYLRLTVDGESNVVKIVKQQ